MRFKWLLSGRSYNSLQIGLELAKDPLPPRGNLVHYNFLKLHYIRHKIKDVSPLRMAALTCNITLYTLPPPPPPKKKKKKKIALNVPDNVIDDDMFVHFCMLTLVYELLITLLHIFSINFIKILSYYRCSIRYLVFPALFMSISMVFIDFTCITSVTECSKSIRLLLKRFKDFFFDRLHYFSGPCYVCYLQNSIKHSS